MSKKDKEEKVVVIFIEGETEIEFYKRLVDVMRTHCGGQLTCSVESIMLLESVNIRTRC